MSLVTEKAESNFKSGCNCSQAVFTTFCEQFGISKEIGMKVSIGMGGGVAHREEICGAVSGGILALGLKYGDSKEETYKMVNILIDKFKSLNGSINCTELVGFNLNDDLQLVKAKDLGVFDSICSKLVKDSVAILEEI